MENEIWKDIKDYEGLYQVSNLGRVKSLSKYINRGIGYYTKEKILKQNICGKNKNGFGYYFVSLCIKYKYQNKMIHRLVAEAFIENKDNLPQVNHLNSIKTELS